MDALRFDAVTRRLARSQHSRRVLLGSGGLGLGALVSGVFASRPGSVAAAPLGQGMPEATPATEHPDALQIDGVWLCNQTFALCTTAICDRSASDPSIANCQCVVLQGYSMGFKTCAERAPAGTSVTSTFSTANVNAEFGALQCPEEAAWANYLDYPCEMDPRNPALATCQCALVERGPSFTFGGRCDPQACTAEIISGTTPDLPGTAQYETGMRRLNQTVTFPQVCPGAPAEASPAAAPTGG